MDNSEVKICYLYEYAPSELRHLWENDMFLTSNQK